VKRIVFASVVFAALALSGIAEAQTKSDRCAAYARNAAANAGTTTGPGRGAARGAAIGSFSANAGRGAAIGAITGGARRAAQRGRSYDAYYRQCMGR